MVLFWFRRDLRLHDNAALYYALKNHKDVQPIFIFDREILNKLDNKKDTRVSFIHDALAKIKTDLNSKGSDLKIYYGTPLVIFKELIASHKITQIYSNRDYEPYARKRDKEIYELLKSHQIEFIGKKDHVIFEKNEVLKGDGTPYSVFTPYSKVWKQQLSASYYKSYPTTEFQYNFIQCKSIPMLTLEEIGFEKSQQTIPTFNTDENILINYKAQRDFPALDATSKISVHLRFGTISIREMVQKALAHSETWLNELIWRDFYSMILYHYPHTIDKSFKPKYDFIPWINNEEHFDKWCKGQTGYPIVDAGMRELNETGFMHNRLRMVTASFLTKHLLIDWRWGERYFAEKLLDFDLASNIGGWQWAASSGCDAAPYFRVFNPYLQTARFDKQEIYIKKWVPEHQTENYPAPIVEHSFARKRAIDTYSTTLKSFEGNAK